MAAHPGAHSHKLIYTQSPWLKNKMIRVGGVEAALRRRQLCQAAQHSRGGQLCQAERHSEGRQLCQAETGGCARLSRHSEAGSCARLRQHSKGGQLCQAEAAVDAGAVGARVGQAQGL